jgi:hypothetical protein
MPRESYNLTQKTNTSKPQKPKGKKGGRTRIQPSHKTPRFHQNACLLASSSLHVSVQ